MFEINFRKLAENFQKFSLLITTEIWGKLTRKKNQEKYFNTELPASHTQHKNGYTQHSYISIQANLLKFLKHICNSTEYLCNSYMWKDIKIN